MNKRHIHHLIKQLRVIRTSYFVIALVILGIVAVVSLRQNNIVALQLRDTVLQTDEKNGDVESALRDLREHVYRHMNSDLAVPGGAYPPVQLKYRYDRLVAVEKERVSAANAQLYTEAQSACEAAIPSGRSLNRIDCIQNYITNKGAVAESSVPDALYKFNFTPPLWSPDLAGWSIVLFSVVLLLLLIRLVAITWLKHSLKD